MAKSQSGLPESFDLNVTATDLAGPAALPGYLDEDPVIEFARIQRTKKVEEGSKAGRAPEAPPALREESVSEPPREVHVSQRATTPVALAPIPPKPFRAQVERKRFQINLDVESERMLEEMLSLLGSQSSENSIKISELFQALLLILHNAKGEIVLGSLPTRGRWGSATAKAFPVNLSQALRNAIIAHEQESGGDPFAKIVGG